MPVIKVRMVFTTTVQMFFFCTLIFLKFEWMVNKTNNLIITLFID